MKLPKILRKQKKLSPEERRKLEEKVREVNRLRTLVKGDLHPLIAKYARNIDDALYLCGMIDALIQQAMNAKQLEFTVADLDIEQQLKDTVKTSQILIGASPSATALNVWNTLAYPVTKNALHGAVSGALGGYIQLLNYLYLGGSSLNTNALMPISGTTTTAGNSIQNNNGAAAIIMPNNPANNDTMTINFNGTNITFTFVTSIGANPGNVLIGVNAAATQANLLALLQAPATTNSTQVALSTVNQYVVNSFSFQSTNSITINGSYTWAQLGFLTQTTNRSVVINGNTYSYSGGESTNTIYGVLPSPAAEPLNSVVHQLPIVTTNNSMTTIPSTFRNDIIGNLKNQIYVGSYASNTVYLSKINVYTDFSQSSPRNPGDGYTATFDGLIKAIHTQETSMYVSWGSRGWTEVDFTLSSDLTHESVVFTVLKTATQQGAIEQSLTANIGNDLAFVSQEPVLLSLGRSAQTIPTPQFTNLSDPIKNDFDSYTSTAFTGGNVKYWKYYVYVSLPSKGIVRRYNLAMGWWDPPFLMPIQCFSVINGLLYGHSSQTDQSYLLDTGNPLTQATDDAGNPMNAIAAFSYESFGDPVAKKNFDRWYVEGYISSNTTLMALTKWDFGGVNGAPVYPISGNPASYNSYQQVIFQTTTDGSLGKNPIGEQPIGTITDSVLNLPKFRIINTGVPENFYEYQAYFSTNGVNQQWAILRFGPKVELGGAPTDITI